jgi:hypothetical protein
VAHDRLERVPYPVLQRLIEQRARQYPGELHIESNGTGDPVIENLNVPAAPFLTTAKTKSNAIQALVLLLEQRRLKAKWTRQERHELTIYRWDDSNLVQDCVISLAIGSAQLVKPESQTFTYTYA